MTSHLNKLLKIWSKIMIQGSINCHKSSSQLASELSLTNQCFHVNEDSTLGSHIPLLDVLAILLYARDLALHGALQMVCRSPCNLMQSSEVLIVLYMGNIISKKFCIRVDNNIMNVIYIYQKKQRSEH